MAAACPVNVVEPANEVAFSSLDEAVAQAEARQERNQRIATGLKARGPFTSPCVTLATKVSEAGKITYAVEPCAAAPVSADKWLASRPPAADALLVAVARVCPAGPVASFADIENLGRALVARVRSVAEAYQDSGEGVTAGFRTLASAALHNLDVLHSLLQQYEADAATASGACGDASARVSAFYERQCARIEEERARDLAGITLVGAEPSAPSDPALHVRIVDLETRLTAAEQRAAEAEAVRHLCLKCSADSGPQTGREGAAAGGGGAASGAITVPLAGSVTAAEAAWLATEIARVSGTAPVDLLTAKPAFRGSVDGFNAKAFSRAMSGKARALVIIHVHYNDVTCVFGLFTTAGFKDLGRPYHRDERAFLFTLRNPHGIPPTAYAITKPDNATWCNGAHQNYMLNFGGNDLVLYNDCEVKAGSYTQFPWSYADTTDMGRATFTGAFDNWLVTDLWGFAL